MSTCTDEDRERESLEISSSPILHLPLNSSFILSLLGCVSAAIFDQISIKIKANASTSSQTVSGSCCLRAAVRSACATVALSCKTFATSVIVFHFILCVSSSIFQQFDSHKLIPLCFFILSVQALLTPTSMILLTASIQAPASAM